MYYLELQTGKIVTSGLHPLNRNTFEEFDSIAATDSLIL
jgi:hypothetical protein